MASSKARNRTDLEPAREPKTVAQEAGYQLRRLGHDLARDAAARQNKRDQVVGHIMRELGALVGNDGSDTGIWKRDEVASPDPVLAKLEQARRALAAAAKLERDAFDARLKRRNDEISEVHRMLGVSGPPLVLDFVDPNEPFEPLQVDESPASIAKRYLTLVLEWGDQAFGRAVDVAVWLERYRQMMQDTILLGVSGSPNEHIEAWTAAIEPILHKDLRARSRAEEIIRACARQQGHSESVAKNLIRD